MRKEKVALKQMLAKLLVFALVFQMTVPVNVMAASVAEEPVQETEIDVTEEEVLPETAAEDFVIDGDGWLTKYTGNATEVVIPEGVTYITEEVFAGKATIEKVVLPDGVCFIGRNAFASCTNLKSINLPATLKGIEEGAFSGCTSLTIDCITLPQNLINLEADAFAGVNVGEVRIEGDLPTRKDVVTCNYAGLSSINASKCTLTYNAVENTSNNGFIRSFFSQGKDKTVVLDFEDADSVNQNSLLSWVQGWYEDTDPDSVKISNMEIKNAPGDAYYFEDGMLFAGTNLLWIGGFLRGEVRIPEGVTWSFGVSGGDPFYSAKDVKVYLPDSMTNIDGVVKEINHPVTIVLPDTLEHLERVTVWFNMIRSALTVVLPESMDNVTFGSASTMNGTTRDVFSEVDTIVIPAAMQKVPDKVLSSAYDLNHIVVESGNETYKSMDGGLYSADGKILYRLPNVKADTTITIPEGVEEIATGAFFAHNSVANLTIELPSTLKKINKYVFESYYTTTKVDLFANKCADDVVLDGAFISKVNKLYVKSENSNWAKKVPCSELIVGNSSVKANVLVKNEDGSTSPCPKGGYSVWVYDANGDIVSDLCAVNADGTVDFFIPQNGTYTLQFNPTMTDGNVYKSFVTDACELVLGEQITIEDVVFERIPVIKVQTNETNVIGYVYDADGKFVCDMSLRDDNLVSEGLKQGTYTVILHKGSDALMKQNCLSDYEELGLKEGEHYAKISGVTIEDKDVSYGEQNVPVVTESGILKTEKCSYITSGIQNPNAGYVNLEIIYAVDESKFNGENAELAVTLPENVKYVADSARFVKGTESTACNAQEGNAAVTFNVGNNLEGVVRFAVEVNGEVDGVSVACLNTTAGKEVIGSVEFSMNTLTMRAPEYTATESVNITGEAPKGKEVSVYIGDVLLGKTTANVAGIWSLDITLPNPVANETYVLNARVQTGSEVVLAYEDVIYLPKAPQVKQIKYHYPQCGGNGYFNVDMNTLRGERVLLTYVSGKVYYFTCDFYLENSENVTELYITYKDGRVKKAVACKKMDNNGKWRLQIPVGVNGFAPNLKLVAVTNESGSEQEMLLADFLIEWIIDPSGYIYEAVSENRVEGATVTIYYKDEAENQVKWNAEEFNQENPLTSDENGNYGWFVPAGEWKVVAEKDGYRTESEWLPVPPPQLDVNLELVSTMQPKVAGVDLASDKMLVRFDNYVLADSFTKENVSLKDTADAAVEIASIEAVDAKTRNEASIAKEFMVTFAAPVAEGTYAATVAAGVKSYADVAMSKAQTVSDLTIAGIVKDLKTPELFVVLAGKDGTFNVSVVSDEEVNGRILTANSADESKVKVVGTTAVDAEGKATITLNGPAMTETEITLGVENSSFTKTVSVMVMDSEEVFDKMFELNDLTKPQDSEEPSVSDNDVPKEPEDPSDPTEPEDPKDPTEPEDPSDPTEPEDPKDPTEPEDPSDPTEPEDPSHPTEPSEPEDDVPVDISRAVITGIEDKVYTGSTLTQDVKVFVSGKVLVKDVDYTVAYKNNIEVGTAKVIFTGIGNYTGTKTVTFMIEKAESSEPEEPNDPQEPSDSEDPTEPKDPTEPEDPSEPVEPSVSDNDVPKDPTVSENNVPADLAKAVVTGIVNKVYTGRALTQDMKVTVDGKTLAKEVDYTVAYKNNTEAGTAQAIITGKGSYTGSKTVTFTIEKAASTLKAENAAYSKAYGAKAFTVKVTGATGDMTYKSSDTKVAKVSKSGKVTIKNTGRAVITVSVAESKNYKAGKVEIVIEVSPKKASINSLSSKKAKQLTVTWKKDKKATGYEVTYSTNKKFKKSQTKTVLVKKAGTTKATLKNLKKGKTYYVKVRAYKEVKVNGKKVKIYSPYSKVLKKKVK